MTPIPVRCLRPGDAIQLDDIGEVEVLDVGYPDRQHADLEVVRPEHAPEVVCLQIGRHVERVERERLAA